MVSSSRLAFLAVAVIALAASVVAQQCAITVTDFGTDSTCATPVTTAQPINAECSSIGSTYPYNQVTCANLGDASSSWIVDAWAPSRGACSGAYAGRAQGAGLTGCVQFGTGSSTTVNSYWKVNCTCAGPVILPTVSSSSASLVSSSSTGLSSSTTPIDYGCSRTVNTFSDTGCATLATTVNPISGVCSPFAILGGTQYYFKLQCASSVEASNWQATVFASSQCVGTVATDLTSDTAVNSCRTGAAVGNNFYANVNCSCALGGRRFSSTGLPSTGLTSTTGQTTNTAGQTSNTAGLTSNTASTTGTGSSSTTGTSSASVSRSGVVAIVAAMVAGAVALLA